MRFTKVAAHFSNKSDGDVIDFSIKQYRGQQNLALHVKMYKPWSPASVRYILCDVLFYSRFGPTKNRKIADRPVLQAVF